LMTRQNYNNALRKMARGAGILLSRTLADK